MRTEFLNPPMTATGSVVNGMALDFHENAVKHGFYEDLQDALDFLQTNDQPWLSETVRRDFVLAQIGKIAGECGEAVDAIQHGDTGGLIEELADVVIRVFDLAAFLDARIGDVIMLKAEKNKARPYKHGKLC